MRSYILIVLGAMVGCDSEPEVADRMFDLEEEDGTDGLLSGELLCDTPESCPSSVPVVGVPVAGTKTTPTPEPTSPPLDGLCSDAANDGPECADGDGDGVVAAHDCDDSAPGIHPFAHDRHCDGIDQNCDGVDTCDSDGDGTPDGTDCDPEDPDVDTECFDPEVAVPLN